MTITVTVLVDPTMTTAPQRPTVTRTFFARGSPTPSDCPWFQWQGMPK
ncbi:MAG: hypothetical protein R2867_16285 [Caldilineaceae bacterium]